MNILSVFTDSSYFSLFIQSVVQLDHGAIQSSIQLNVK